MSEINLNTKQKALRKAVTDYCEKTGVNAATISVVTEKFVGMLAARWEHICDVAIADENGGKVKVGFGINFDMTHKVPVGTMAMSFSQVTKDDCNFQVDDPNQPALPFAEAVRQQRPATPRTQAQPSSGPSTNAPTGAPLTPLPTPPSATPSATPQQPSQDRPPGTRSRRPVSQSNSTGASSSGQSASPSGSPANMTPSTTSSSAEGSSTNQPPTTSAATTRSNRRRGAPTSQSARA
jgi:hypothetical protein